MIGQTISHYKILDKLGEGGMGVVYKAQDTNLDRIVALKFLPSGTGLEGPEGERFIQEAKTAASLNHPNIYTIHGIERDGEQQFIAMESMGELMIGTAFHILRSSTSWAKAGLPTENQS